MPDWVEKHKPYEPVSTAELRLGTVLRRVPFPKKILGSVAFHELDEAGKDRKIALEDISVGSSVARSDKVVISPGVVLTPDCDIFTHKCNALTVAQLQSPEAYIALNAPKKDVAERIRADVKKAHTTNPGVFDHRGLLLLPGDPVIGFEDSLVLLENHISMPIEFVSTTHAFTVTQDTVAGVDNIWFRIKDDPLRIRLVNEFARQVLRIGLEDA